MKPTYDNIAVVFFSRRPEEEADYKKIVGRKKANKRILNLLIDRSLNEVKKTGLHVIVSSAKLQQGRTFGERLANAVEGAFDQGFEHVITVGNDCPQLSSALILSAAQNLCKKGMVLGPATDGGVYLIGVSKSRYDRSRFIDQPWQSSLLFASLNRETAVVLPLLSDVDDKNSLATSLLHLKAKPYTVWFFNAIVNILFSGFSRIVIHTGSMVTNITVDSLRLRPPPSY